MGIHPFNFLGGGKHNVLCDLRCCWICFCFLDPYVHKHHVLRKCCWEFGKHNHYWLNHTSWCVFCSTIQWNNSVECSQKKNLKLSKLKFIIWIYFVNGLLICEFMCNEKLRTSSVVHPILVKWLVIFDFVIKNLESKACSLALLSLKYILELLKGIIWNDNFFSDSQVPFLKLIFFCDSWFWSWCISWNTSPSCARQFVL